MHRGRLGLRDLCPACSFGAPLARWQNDLSRSLVCRGLPAKARRPAG